MGTYSPIFMRLTIRGNLSNVRILFKAVKIMFSTEQHISIWSLIIEGAQLKLIYNKKICFHDQKCISEHFRKVKTKTIFI